MTKVLFFLIEIYYVSKDSELILKFIGVLEVCLLSTNTVLQKTRYNIYYTKITVIEHCLNLKRPLDNLLLNHKTSQS